MTVLLPALTLALGLALSSCSISTMPSNTDSTLPQPMKLPSSGFPAGGATPAKKSGGVDGGGGKSVICRDASGAITSAEVLDLYEARTLYGHTITKSSDPVDQQLDAALARLPVTSRSLVSTWVSVVKKGMKIVPNAQLNPVNDSLEIQVPKDCAAEQTANYYNDHLIVFNGDIWDRLSATDQAALILHEAVYATNRMVGATDSRTSRHIVGTLFDTMTSWPDPLDGVPQDALTCISQKIPLTFRAYQNSSHVWVLQYQVLGFAFTPTAKMTYVMEPSFDLNEAKTFPVLQGEDKIGTGTVEASTTQSEFETNDTVMITKRWESIADGSGKVIRGFQTPKYYLSWKSGTLPNTGFDSVPLNCTVQIPSHP